MEGKGTYAAGRGKASKRLAQYRDVFNCPMIGTFNIKTDLSLESAPPAFSTLGGAHRYWLVWIGDRYGWAIRWTGSRMKPTTWEVLSKTPLPDEYKSGELEIAICDRWAKDRVAAWASKIKWYQSFPWGPQRADSELVWRVIEREAGPLAGKTVLDIGCNFGFHAFAASKAGASVIGFDKNKNVLPVARTINEHIEMQDVRFIHQDPGGPFDFIFYLSVQHQWDPKYAALREMVAGLASRARGKLFLELIVPPLSKALLEEEVDFIVGGKILTSYKHAVRGIRKIYAIDGSAEQVSGQ